MDDGSRMALGMDSSHLPTHSHPAHPPGCCHAPGYLTHLLPLTHLPAPLQLTLNLPSSPSPHNTHRKTALLTDLDVDDTPGDPRGHALQPKVGGWGRVCVGEVG